MDSLAHTHTLSLSALAWLTRRQIRRAGGRMIGPNCVGLYDPGAGIDSVFLDEQRVMRPKSGPIRRVHAHPPALLRPNQPFRSVISQSGGMVILVMNEIVST